MNESQTSAPLVPAVELIIDPPQDPQLRFVGDWSGKVRLPPLVDLSPLTQQGDRVRLGFDSSGLAGWDSRFITWVMRLLEAAESHALQVRQEGLPPGVQGLIHLARVVPAEAGRAAAAPADGLLHRTGRRVVAWVEGSHQLLAFLGELTLACGRLLLGRARFPVADFILFVQQTGVNALPIVILISMLVGMILAFVGALQLALFGAQIYIANLVAIGMVREMGAMMAAILMAGRTGAAFSAQLGSMQVNEEIDAFRTFGIPPLEYLVLPRMLALTLMMPLLCIFADLFGILGGMTVGIALFDISFPQYLEQTRISIDLVDIAVGIVKSLVFGILISVAGCFHGISCGRSAAAVGEATTSAVVTAIVAIVVSDAIMTLISDALGV